MDLDDVTLPDDALYYLCGPIPFMQAVRNELLERGVTVRARASEDGRFRARACASSTTS